ncbi:MAG: acetoacetate--CoA ligase [Candidatus Helarchaeota archaeon]
MTNDRIKLWVPSKDWIQKAQVSRFIEFINTKYHLKIVNGKELYQWSVENIPEFWAAMWDFSGIVASQPYSTIVDDLTKFPGCKFFLNAKLNFAENLLRYNDDHLAFIFQGETRKTKKLTYTELNEIVARLAHALQESGIKVGDRVVSYIPNLIETPVAMLAATSLGAIWASCGAELQPSAVIDRFNQIEPKVLFTVDGYFYKNQIFNTLPNVKTILNAIPTIETVVVVPYVSEKRPDIDGIPHAILWDNFLMEGKIEPKFVQLPFNHPVYIMFSSGTTGKPKCMVQGAGGVLINHLKELILSHDLKRSDVINYITAPSWMMWNWLISSLAVGATIFLYDGNPFYPHPLRMFELIEQYKISIFGTSATYIHFLMGQSLKPKDEYNLSSLREISQTASVLSPEGFKWVYQQIKEDLYFNSISGGTDINGCFASALPILPVYSGEIQGKALAMKVQAYDEMGKPVKDIQGELVCEAPAPSMPLYFWGDDAQMTLYKAAYFDFYKEKGINVWRHGDWIIEHSDTGGITFLGRSDATLKPAGVRIGTAEIYNVVEQFPEILDSLAVGLPNIKGDIQVILFVELAEGVELTDNLCNKIRKVLREKTSPRHVPSRIIQVPPEGIPYTFSGKKVEIAVTKILRGMPVANRGALRNPDSLNFYEKIRNTL